MSSRVPSLLTVEDDLVEAKVLFESMIGGDDDTKLRLSSRKHLRTQEKSQPVTQQTRGMVRKNTRCGGETKIRKTENGRKFLDGPCARGK